MSLSPASFEFVRALLRERSAEVLDDDKVYLVETRLLPVARRHSFKSIDDLVLHVYRTRQESLVTEIVEAMTINETSFFRDENVFRALRQFVLPELIRQRSHLRQLNIWSASCSSGQEPFSIALLLRQYFPLLASWTIRLLASDLSLEMLNRARRGVYSDLEISRGLPAEMLANYFHKNRDGWRIGDDLLRMVEYRQINLSGPWPELPSLDLIFLRNVLIYFDTSTRQQILNKMRQVLHPNGYLILGGAETTHNLDDHFLSVVFENVSFFQLRSTTSATTF